MERSHSPQEKENPQSQPIPLDFHHLHHIEREKTGKSSNNNNNSIHSSTNNNGNSPSNLSVRRDERSKSKSPHLNNHSHHQYHHNNHQHHSSSSSLTMSNGGSGSNNSHKTTSSSSSSSSRGHYSPLGESTTTTTTTSTGTNSTNNTTTSNSPNSNGPLTKNVGVGANLNLAGRHSSGSVSVGHGLLGSINGPSSVSISTGLNSSLTISSSSSANSNNNSGSGASSSGCTSSTAGSGRGGLNRDSGTITSQQGHQSSSGGILSHSPGLIPSTILPELLQAHVHAAAVAAAAAAAATSAQSGNNSSGGGSGGGLSSSSSSSNSGLNSSTSTSNNKNSNGNITSSSSSSLTSSRGGNNGIVSNSNNNTNPSSSITTSSSTTTTKVGISSPVKQGILGRHQRGEMINGSTSSATTTASKIVSQNVNGTLALTGIPTNESELQLFRVLQRANLLSYFDVMIELGGDDVQQLCEAGEEEFLEIMALIGMASKPLHVRRLQKALQEWMSNPTLFQSPVLPPGIAPFGGPTGRAGGPGSISSTARNNNSSSGNNLISPVPSVPTVPTTVSQLAQLPVTTSPINRNNSVSPLALQINSSSGGLPIRPIPYHSGVGGAPSAAAAMAAAAAAAAQQGVFFSPSEIKSLQNKLQVMTNGHNSLGGGGGGGRGSSSSSPTGGNATLTSNGPLLVRNSHQSPTNLSTSGASLASVNQSFSNGYHHHPPRNHHGSSSDSHHRFDRESSSSSSHKDKDFHHQIQHLVNSSMRIPADQIIPSHFLEQRIRTASEPNSPAASESASESGSSLSPVPFLQETEIFKLAEAAMQIVKSLPPYVFEPQVPSKRKFSGDFDLIMRLPLNDPRRIDEIRKASTIYGRPDPYSSTHQKSRKFPKPLSMHEVSVNEAAAQLCRHVPALVTRREELFALAKQVVRDAGLPYSNNNFSISLITNNNNSNNYSNHNLKHKRDSHQIELNHYHQNSHHHNNNHHHLHSSDHREFRESNGFSSKRLRLDGDGIEIQEYNRPLSNNSELASDSQDNAMQITPIRNLPRRSLSDDQQHSPLPLELVTVTSSSPHRSSESGSPPSSMLRRSTESDDLISGFKLVNNSPSIKITSIPVSGGLINISHDQNITGSSGPLTLLPIKTEPAN